MCNLEEQVASIRQEQDQMKSDQARLRQEVGTLQDRVEANEQNQRQLNLRIYGFDAKNNGGGPHLYKHPKEVWLQLLRDGLQFAEADARAIELAQCHWAGQGAVLIVRFIRGEDRQRVLSQRRRLGAAYKPNGRVISLVDDRTRKQTLLHGEVSKICRSLCAKGYRAYNVNGKIKIDSKFYSHTDPHITAML